MNNPQRYLIGLLFGFFLGTGIFYLVSVPTENAMLADMKDCNAKNAALQHENAELREQVQGQGQILKEHFGDITVLYEPAPQSGVISLLSVISGKPIPQQQGMVPTWVIPLHVVPIVSPQNAAHVRVVYVDKDGRPTPGAPEIAAQ